MCFRLISACYERGSIIVATNTHVQDWPEFFAGDEIPTAAILDRLLHHVHAIHIDGRSYRLRELDSLLTPKPEAAPTNSPPARGVREKKPGSTA